MWKYVNLLLVYSVFGSAQDYVSPCHCAFNDECDVSKGICPRGCQEGWHGLCCQEGNIAAYAYAVQINTNCEKQDYNETTTGLGRCRFSADKAVDGMLPSVPGGTDFCSQTFGFSSSPWWYVMFNDSRHYVIQEVRITVGVTIQGSQIGNFSILISNETLEYPTVNRYWKPCAYVESPSSANISYTCRGMVGKRLAIVMHKTAQLNLCEVSVIGYPFGGFQRVCGRSAIITFRCHCKDSTACDPWNGFCPNGCASGWSGPGCQRGQTSQLLSVMVSNGTAGLPNPNTWTPCSGQESEAYFRSEYDCTSTIGRRVAVYASGANTTLTLCKVEVTGYMYRHCPPGKTGVGCLLHTCDSSACRQMNGSCNSKNECIFPTCPGGLHWPPGCWKKMPNLLASKAYAANDVSGITVFIEITAEEHKTWNLIPNRLILQVFNATGNTRIEERKEYIGPGVYMVTLKDQQASPDSPGVRWTPRLCLSKQCFNGPSSKIVSLSLNGAPAGAANSTDGQLSAVSAASQAAYTSGTTTDLQIAASTNCERECRCGAGVDIASKIALLIAFTLNAILWLRMTSARGEYHSL